MESLGAFVLFDDLSIIDDIKSFRIFCERYIEFNEYELGSLYILFCLLRLINFASSMLFLRICSATDGAMPVFIEFAIVHDIFISSSERSNHRMACAI